MDTRNSYVWENKMYFILGTRIRRHFTREKRGITMDVVMKREYKKLILSGFIGSLCMERGIFILLLAYKGLSVSQIAFWQATLNVGMFLAEVPTGFMADIFGKKKSLIAGRILYIVYYYLLITSNQYSTLIVSALVFGIGSTFISGTMESFLYDILLDKNSKETCNTGDYLGKFSAIIIIGTGISMAIGGEVQKLSWEVLLAICLGLQLLSIFFIYSIKIQETQNSSIVETLNNYKRILKNELTQKKIVIFVIALGINIGIVSALYIFAQEGLSNFGVSISKISMFFAVESIGSFLLLYNLDKFENSLKNDKSMIIISLISCVFFGLLFIHNKYVFMAVILLIMFSNQFFAIIMFDKLNLMVDEKVRTTIVSVFNSVSSLIMAFIFYVISKISTQYMLFFSMVGILSYILMILYILNYTEKN